MRFRNKNERSVFRFVFERPVQDEPPHPRPAVTAAALENPYGRYYTRARTREDLQNGRSGCCSPADHI